MGSPAERREAADGRQGRPPDVWTIGHSTRSLDELAAALAAHGIERVADVRRFPASRRHPHFSRESLARDLADRGVGYRWCEALGGRRRPDRDSPNAGLRVAGFRAYADYMRTDEFRRAFRDLLAWAEGGRTAILCAERLWWQCHRRLLSDLLVARGGTVRHIADEGRAAEHPLWELARVTPEGLVYPPEQPDLGI